MTPTRTIAFAGAARQAEMVRAGEVSPTELVRLYLDRIERLDPQLNSFRMVFAEQALLEAEQAEARLKAGEERPLLGRADRDQGRSRRRRRGQHPRHRRLRRAGQGRLRDGAAPARGGRDRRRQDAAARAGDLRLHRVGDLGRHPQPLEPAAHPGRLQRRLAPPRSRRGWSRSPRPPTAPARSASPPPPAASSGSSRQRGRVSLAPDLEHWNGLSVYGCVSRTVLDTALWLDVVAGGSRGAGGAARRPSGPSSSRRRRRPASCASPTRPRRRGPRRRRPSPTRRQGRGRRGRRAAALARPRGRASTTRTGAGSATTSSPRYLRGIAEDFAEVPQPERLERRTRGFGRLGRTLPDCVFERRDARRARPTPPASTRSSTPTTC